MTEREQDLIADIIADEAWGSEDESESETEGGDPF
jgi:hypothetical protein